ncbi:unnamed protein product [Urochloa humidicola]
MRATDTLQGLMDLYYAIVTTVPRGVGVFLYQGKRLDGKETPASHKMKNGDRIDFLSEMKPSMFVTLTVQDYEGRRITRTMLRSENMHVLMDFYRAMVPAIAACGKGVFMYRGRQVEGERTPVDYKMEDSDQIDFFLSAIKPAKMFITLHVMDGEGRRLTRTMRRSDKFQDLMDFYFASVPIVAYGDGMFMFDGSRLIKGWQTPEDLDMEDCEEIDFFRAFYG